MPAGTTNLSSSESPLDPIVISTATFRWSFVSVIMLSSLITLIEASGLTGRAANGDVVVLASIEIGAILAFATERWRGWAAVGLVLIFAIAFTLSAVEGEFGARFIYFAASAIYLQGVDHRQARGPTFG